MSLTKINLKPYWNQNEKSVYRMDVTITVTGLSYRAGERLCHMPNGGRGICTFGEHTITDVTLEKLRQSYFAMGQLHAIEEGDFGFYWMSQPPFDMEEVAEYTKKLFVHMQKFFKDTEKVYRIFVRKDPFVTSGGTASLTTKQLQNCKRELTITIPTQQDILETRRQLQFAGRIEEHRDLCTAEE